MDDSEPSRRVRLTELRDRLTCAVADAAPRELAPLAKQLRETLAELDGLPLAKEPTPVDDIATRRAARRSRASGS